MRRIEFKAPHFQQGSQQRCLALLTLMIAIAAGGCERDDQLDPAQEAERAAMFYVALMEHTEELLEHNAADLPEQIEAARQRSQELLEQVSVACKNLTNEQYGQYSGRQFQLEGTVKYQNAELVQDRLMAISGARPELGPVAQRFRSIRAYGDVVELRSQFPEDAARLGL